MEASIVCFDLPCTIFSQGLPGFLGFSVDSVLFRLDRRPLVVKLIFGFIVAIGNHFIIRLRILLKGRFRVSF